MFDVKTSPFQLAKRSEVTFFFKGLNRESNAKYKRIVDSSFTMEASLDWNAMIDLSAGLRDVVSTRTAAVASFTCFAVMAPMVEIFVLLGRRG